MVPDATWAAACTALVAAKCDLRRACAKRDAGAVAKARAQAQAARKLLDDLVFAEVEAIQPMPPDAANLVAERRKAAEQAAQERAKQEQADREAAVLAKAEAEIADDAG